GAHFDRLELLVTFAMSGTLFLVMPMLMASLVFVLDANAHSAWVRVRRISIATALGGVVGWFMWGLSSEPESPVLFAVAIWVVLFLILALLVAWAVIGRRPSLVRVSGCLLGAVIGGLVALPLWGFINSEAIAISLEIDDFFSSLGFQGE